MASMLKFVAVAHVAAVAQASDFLAAQRHGQSISKEAVEQMLSIASSARLSALTEELRPTFMSLPKK